MKSEQIQTAIKGALEALMRHDRYLLEIDANERTISHRLALYLESYFEGWDVDCEYNRNHDDTKRLELEARQVSDEDLEAVTVYPDIIVHKRSTDENLLVIEIKKSSSREDVNYDYKKLRGFKTELGYIRAVFICLKVGGDAGLKTVDYV